MFTSMFQSPPLTVTFDSTSAAIAEPAAILRRRPSISSTMSRFSSRSQIHTLPYSGTTFGTSPPLRIA